MTENQTDETVDEQAPSPNLGEGADFQSETIESDDVETFPRDYVVKLRDENAKYRQRAQDRDDVAKRLHTALVAATGRLADPTDLAFDEGHIDHADKMVEAIEELLQAKPHLACRMASGIIGQGVSVVSDTVSLSGLLKANAS